MPFSDITGFCFFAEAKFGGNGGSGGPPEYVVGRSNTDNVWSRKTWDPNVSDGVESGWVKVILTASAGGSGGVGWSVYGGTDQLTYSGVSYQNISELRFRAGVRGAGRLASWRNVRVFCYESEDTDRPVAEFLIEELVADRWDQTQPGDAEAISPLTLGGIGYVAKVTVEAEVRFAAKNPYPAANALFADVFIFAEDCN
jgi:hypothetical protein